MIDKKALCVGVNYYQNGNSLNSCVKDALNVSEILSTNEDSSPNFSVKKLLISEEKDAISREDLLNALEKLFMNDESIGLFYFSGHGAVKNNNAMLCCSDGSVVYLREVIDIIEHSKVKNKIVVLDSCFAGGIGDFGVLNDSSIIPKGTTILTACSKTQTALEDREGGIFTKLFVEAMKGGNADLVGNITVGSVYSYIDLALGAWEQRPILKTNVNNFVVLRKKKSSVSIEELHNLVNLFDKEDYLFELDPTFEETQINANPENVKKFKLLQKFNQEGVVVPVGCKYMYYAAIESKSCKLTEKGQLYWRLVKNNKM